MKRLGLILVALVLLPVAACSMIEKPSGEDFYAQAQSDFADKDYKASIENYQKLIDQFPFSPYAEDAELKIGLAHYQEKDYAEAVAALDDFQRMHPTSKDLDLVTYYIAMSYYDQIGREDQDQTKTQQALKRFEEVEQRFPEGDFAELAREHIVVCREMLARNEMLVGNYYFKRANFRAAESRFAELMQQYPDTPVAPDALFDLGLSLEKEGKKYSAAQAFAAVEKHFPNTGYAKRAHDELNKIHQPVDTEEDPLPIVLAETGYGSVANDADKVLVRQRSDIGPGDGTSSTQQTAYGSDGLPILGGASAPSSNSGGAASNSGSPAGNSGDNAGYNVPGVSAGVVPASASAPAVEAAAAPARSFPSEAQLADSVAAPAALPVSPNAPAALRAMWSAPQPPVVANPKPDSAASDGAFAAIAQAITTAPSANPAMLKSIELSAGEQPMSVVIKLSGPVQFDKHLERGPSGSIAMVVLKDVIPQTGTQTHLVFGKSIFKDCDITTDAAGTTVTLNTRPVSNFSVVALESPPRLLVSFTPEKTAAN
ncbi:MAG TPA: outer membrane protein assembly factor BamD [Candidatus Binataceae bacterium]|nr:outer membrane protein assembly factor BamD [Candidatus Binataceae bacterium]